MAIQADIKAMFYQVRIPSKDRDLLRFLWWKNENVEDIEEYRITVYPFGTASSPNCANFALRRTVTDHEQEYVAETLTTACSGFYVDDCLTSTSSVETATSLVHELRSLLSKGGFCLTQRISNSREVMNSIPKLQNGLREL